MRCLRDEASNPQQLPTLRPTQDNLFGFVEFLKNSAEPIPDPVKFLTTGAPPTQAGERGAEVEISREHAGLALGTGFSFLCPWFIQRSISLRLHRYQFRFRVQYSTVQVSSPVVYLHLLKALHQGNPRNLELEGIAGNRLQSWMQLRCDELWLS